MRSWYVAKTKPHREEQTSAVLEQRGLEVYLPRIAVWTGRQPDSGTTCSVSTKLECLFPGYLFARLDVSSPEWVLGRSAPGVAYFLGIDGRPSPVPDELVEGVRQQAGAQQGQEGPPTFRSGDRVVFTSGPLAGLEAVFGGMLSPAGRSRVFIQVLSRFIPVVVSAELLRRVG